MTRDLLWRGMLAGILAAMLATLFARVVAEPQVDRAIAYEATHEAHHDGGEIELVSRATQKGAGLLTAMTLYGAAIGGVFAIVFAYGYGRLARIGPRSFAALLALAGFVVVALVPALKYPPSPPAVGAHDTVAFRTAAYFAMLIVSVIAAIAAIRVRAMAERRWAPFDAVLAGIAAYLAIVVLMQMALPSIDEVPADFPASTLWTFRVSALGIPAILWATIGLSFGTMAEKLIARSGG